MRSLKLLLGLFAATLIIGCTGPNQGTDTGSVGIDEGGPVGTTPDVGTPGDSGNSGNTPMTSLKLFSSTEGKDPNWLDTGADNSLDESEFTQVIDSNEGAVFSVDAPPEELNAFRNAHSHFQALESHSWENYKFTGKMMMETADDALGVTFYSDFPNRNSYYRIRRYVSDGHRDSPYTAGLHLAPHPTPDVTGYSNAERCSGSQDRKGRHITNIFPEALTWYNFEIEVTTAEEYTEVKAKIWTDLEAKPDDYQIFCRDKTEYRIKKGTVGIWSGMKGDQKYLDRGEKYYKDFQVDFQVIKK